MGDNAVVTIEECDTGITCGGLAIPNPCPTIKPTTVKPEQDPGHVTLDPNGVNVNTVSDNPVIEKVPGSSGNILKAFGFIIAFLAILV